MRLSKLEFLEESYTNESLTMITKSQESGVKPHSENCMLIVFEHPNKICTLQGLHPTAKRLLEEDGIQLLKSHGPNTEYACSNPAQTLINALESIGYSFFNRYDVIVNIESHTIHEAEAVKIARIPTEYQNGPKLKH